MSNKTGRIKGCAIAGVIAALYTVFSLPLAAVAVGPIQVRPSEILTLLPLFFPESILGVVLGCFLTNLLIPSGLGIVDIIGGTLATALSSWLTFRIGRNRKKSLKCRLILGALPPIILNGLIVGSYLVLFFADKNEFTVMAWAVSILSVMLSETVTVGIIGVPLMYVLNKRFKFDEQGSNLLRK